ncbi:hypothetical protein [Streptomyces tanashiensis]|uniref:hypothetical protein n=1 Tax=Streptomyces tanashiensis TaxID=67367 RepID=UPI0033D90F7F
MTTDFRVRPARPADAGRLAALRWTFKREDHEGRPPSERSAPLYQRLGFQPPEELLELPLGT